MANGIGLIDDVPMVVLATGVAGELGEGEADPVLRVRLSSTEREESCLTEARSFSGTVSPALQRDSSASYLKGQRTNNIEIALYKHDTL